MPTAKLSATALAALIAGTEREDGRVYAPQRTLAPLVGRRLVENPHYEYSRGRHSWATITDAGRAAVEESRP